MGATKVFLVLALSLLLFGCNTPTKTTSNPDNEFVGKWRSFSDTKNTQILELYQDGTWTFSSSSGTWIVESIDAADWQKWGVDDYGPTRKMVLYGWNGDVADGPIEETAQEVDFFMVIYNVDLDAYAQPAQIQIKYGHSDWD